MGDNEPLAIRLALAKHGYVILPHAGRKVVGTQWDHDLLRKRVYGAAACLGRKASTHVGPLFIFGWLR